MLPCLDVIKLVVFFVIACKKWGVRYPQLQKVGVHVPLTHLKMMPVVKNVHTYEHLRSWHQSCYKQIQCAYALLKLNFVLNFELLFNSFKQVINITDGQWHRQLR